MCETSKCGALTIRVFSKSVILSEFYEMSREARKERNDHLFFLGGLSALGGENDRISQNGDRLTGL